MTFPSRSSVVSILGLLLLGAAASCSQSLSAGAKSGKDGNKRSVAVVHEPCNPGSSSRIVDANNDGKPELTTVMSGDQMSCQIMDLNFDGVVDRYTYYDRGGQLRRVESDYDRDGRVDEIALYQGGQLIEKQREMNLDGKLDAWVYYENGNVVKQERDTDGDGRVDEWWQYPGGNDMNGSPCVIISKDIDGDGLPEPTSQLETCKQEQDATAGALPNYLGSAAPPPPPPPASAPAPASSAPSEPPPSGASKP